jgi:hypothetical protein
MKLNLMISHRLVNDYVITDLFSFGYDLLQSFLLASFMNEKKVFFFFFQKKKKKRVKNNTKGRSLQTATRRNNTSNHSNLQSKPTKPIQTCRLQPKPATHEANTKKKKERRRRLIGSIELQLSTLEK